MEFSKAFSFVFNDTDWVKKILIIALVSLIPVVGWLVLAGWGLEITRRIVVRDPSPLPELDFGADIGRGFKLFVVALVYSLVIIVGSIVFGILNSAMANSSSSTTNTLAVLLSCCFGLFAFIYGVALAFFLPAALGRLADTGKLGDAFRLGEIFGLVKAAPVPYLLVVVGTFISGAIAGLGLIACVIGVLATLVYSVAINSHLTGQAYLVATQNKAPVSQ